MPNRMASAWMLPSMFAVLAMSMVSPADATDRSGAANRAECLHPAKVRGWNLLANDNVLVDAGRRRFVIELAGRCPGLDDNPFLGFISNDPGSRVCGSRGDRLVPHGAAGGRAPCPIQRVRAIDDAEYANQLQQRVSLGAIGS